MTSTERQAKLLSATVRVANNIASILDPQELLQRTVDIICDEFNFYYSGVFLLSEDKQYALLKAGRGKAGDAMLAEDHKLKVGGNSMIGASISTQEARIALDVGEEAIFFSNPHLPDTRSEMALPLTVGTRVLGAVTVQSVEESAFSDEDISTLQGMADQLAIAIDNADQHAKNQFLLKQAERRARLLDAANEVGRGVASILELNELLPKTVDIICEAYNFYYAGVFLIDENKEYAVLRAGRGEAGKAMIAANHKLKLGGKSMIGMAARERLARISLDVEGEDAFFRNPHLPETRSEMALPLCTGKSCLGAVTVQSIEGNAFSDDDIQTLQTMADHLAIAINNANLLKEVERTHAELLRTKTYEALSSATTEAIHWIGNKALPITTTAARMVEDLNKAELDVESLKEDLGMIDESAKLIMDVKEALLGPARETAPRPVMLADLWLASAYHAKTPSEKLTVKSTPGTPLAVGDSVQLVRAFGNLLRNADESGGKSITIETMPSETAGFVTTRISDNGIGIPEAMQDKIWASFFSTKGEGFKGMGLAACTHIISQMNGSISVESVPEKGTTFIIELPVAEKAPTVDLSGAPGKVVLIAPEGNWTSFVSTALNNAGKNVLDKFDPNADILLLDETLAEKTLPTLEKLGGKTLIISAAPSVENITKYLQSGVKDVILKPYTSAELSEVLG
ncbi:MAG: GAF domain-containing protein [Anaerolineae bacterium]|jgi:K+-sensing histidine kinase KdpD|nr:GAF domain-containing protein [Anaerolineae bacterium]MBT4311939.1 GAF domain-containing protein [Anaerolineae bacterium]MBT4457479.1 GAF domain-containing protein [Anaerolineae bacterium]MBT6060388.1 GAF domain-containing protein [Anaerolineae bacterium]MBT6321132.1 GAF domain-containing protein [Anaerolineae bacterium]